MPALRCAEGPFPRLCLMEPNKHGLVASVVSTVSYNQSLRYLLS
jgi:hypothetical protein